VKKEGPETGSKEEVPTFLIAGRQGRRWAANPTSSETGHREYTASYEDDEWTRVANTIKEIIYRFARATRTFRSTRTRSVYRPRISMQSSAPCKSRDVSERPELRVQSRSVNCSDSHFAFQRRIGGF